MEVVGRGGDVAPNSHFWVRPLPWDLKSHFIVDLLPSACTNKIILKIVQYFMTS